MIKSPIYSVLYHFPASTSDFVNASAFTNGIEVLDKLQSKGTVVCGFLTNGLVDSYDGQGDVQSILSTTIGIYANSIRMAQDKTKCKMIVIMPFARPKPEWLSKQHDYITTTLTKKLGQIEGIELTPPIMIHEQLFESDGIHLNDLGLSMLHAHLMSTCTAFRKVRASVSRPSVSDDLDVFAELGSGQGGRKRQGSPVNQTSQKTKRKEDQTDERMSTESQSTDDGVTITVTGGASSSHDMAEVVRSTIQSEMSKYQMLQAKTNTLVSDRIKNLDSEILILNENTDTAINLANRHILLCSGLKGTISKDRRDKNKQAVKSAEDFLTKISAGKVDLMFTTFIPGPPPRPGCLPMLKMSFGSHGDAFHVKKRFDEFRKTNQRMCADIYLSPELTRATRVRASIMLAMIKKRKVQELVKDAKPQVNKFEPKPDIIFRDTKTGKIERRVSFKEACDRFLHLLNEDDLIIVRKIAGKAFSNRLGFLFKLTEN